MVSLCSLKVRKWDATICYTSGICCNLMGASYFDRPLRLRVRCVFWVLCELDKVCELCRQCVIALVHASASFADPKQLLLVEDVWTCTGLLGSFGNGIQEHKRYYQVIENYTQAWFSWYHRHRYSDLRFRD